MHAEIKKSICPFVIVMRLHRPIGTLLLLWPTLWAVWIAAEGKPSWRIVAIFLLGVFLMRSAGCVINDIADRKFDGHVKRTSERPLATGQLSLKHALLLFLSLCCLSLILVLQLNTFTILLSVVGLLLATLYPFTKRWTHFPQLVLGAAYGWGVPMAFAAERNSLPNVAWLLYVIALLWPVAYDSIYALMDKEDDLRIGVKSTAVFFGSNATRFILFLQVSVLVGFIFLGLVLNFKAVYFYALIVGMLLIGYQQQLIRKEEYYQAFVNNHWLGFVIFLGIFFTYSIT